jgi:hypothetical protein
MGVDREELEGVMKLNRGVATGDVELWVTTKKSQLPEKTLQRSNWDEFSLNTQQMGRDPVENI